MIDKLNKVRRSENYDGRLFVHFDQISGRDKRNAIGWEAEGRLNKVRFMHVCLRS